MRVQSNSLWPFLIKNIDIFVWSPIDMPGIELEVLIHHLNMNPAHQLAKQEKRSFVQVTKGHYRRNTEANHARFIREVNYPDQLTNVMLVKKASGKWRMCMTLQT